MNYPTGVELHNGKIRISFKYRGVRCREVLQGWVVSNANIKKAGNLRSLIVGEIQLGTFDYAARFPESKALKKFSISRPIATFKEMSAVFLSAKALEVSAASYANLNSNVNTLVNLIGDEKLVTDIQHTDILRYRRELLTGEVTNKKIPCFNKQGRAPSTVNVIINVLCAILRLAQRDQHIRHSPHESINMLKVSKKEPDPLLLDEYHAFISVLSRRQALIWQFLVHTGLRHGEFCALAWEDVDLVTGEIHISRNLTEKGLFVPPKTDAGIRTITLLQPAVEALREQHQVTGMNQHTTITYHHRELGRTEQQKLNFVFAPGHQSRDKSPHYARSSLGSSWKRAVKKAGIRRRKPYQSRHTFACWLLSAGANPAFIASQMGHENAKMVYEVYSKWISGMSQDQVSMLNSKLHTALPPACPRTEVENNNDL